MSQRWNPGGKGPQGVSLGELEVLYVDCDASYKDAYLSQSPANYILKISLFYCMYTTSIKLLFVKCGITTELTGSNQRS